MFAARIIGRCSPAVLRSFTTVSGYVRRPVVHRFAAPEKNCLTLRTSRSYQTEAQTGWRSWEASRKPVGVTGCYPNMTGNLVMV